MREEAPTRSDEAAAAAPAVPRLARPIAPFWAPLALTWLMMSLEGPLLGALIARSAEPKLHLAAYGIAYAFALIAEAPVIMMLSASTALVEGPRSYRALRRFHLAVNLLVTVGLLAVVATPAFDAIVRDAMALPEEVARLTRGALWILLPWPAAIGYRRFHQGLLIRFGSTRRVAYGTAVRLSTIAATALVLYRLGVPGADLGAAALATGVCVEAAATRWMAAGVVRRLAAARPSADEPALGLGTILEFYWPLALTSMISLGVHPMVSFFLGRGRMPLDSLAVYPVVNSISFVFRSIGLSYQEVVIAFLAEDEASLGRLWRFAAGLMTATTAIFALLVFTPAVDVLLVTVAGLGSDLARFAAVPLRVLAPMPALSVLLAFQRALLVYRRRTRPVTVATLVEVVGILFLLLAASSWTRWAGVVAAAAALAGGRTLGNLYLAPPAWRARRPEAYRRGATARVAADGVVN